jgi:hypothetical protein
LVNAHETSSFEKVDRDRCVFFPKTGRGNEKICEARVGMSPNQRQAVEKVASEAENAEGFWGIFKRGMERTLSETDTSGRIFFRGLG